MKLFDNFSKKIKELYTKIDHGYIYKPYIHFDKTPLPHFVLSLDDHKLNNIIESIFSELEKDKLHKNTNKYSFLPLLRVEDRTYKFRLNKNSKSQQRKLDKENPKIRPITYCSNVEKIIYIYYNLVLEDFYEAKINFLGLHDNILAYRKIPKKINTLIDKVSYKCNIDFAKDSFQYINNSVEKYSKCTAIALDITGFFDNISHDILKKEWMKIMNTEKLPEDHFYLYRSVTKYSFIRKPLLTKYIFKLKNIKQKNKAIHGWSNKSEKDNLKNSFRYGSLRLFNFENNTNLTMKEIINDCKKYQSTEKDGKFPQKIFQVNDECFGIPQGLPISGILSNIAFLSIDVAIKSLCEKYKANYQRYCDDLLILIPELEIETCKKIEQQVVNIIQANKRVLTAYEIQGSKINDEIQTLNEKPFLTINTKKTEVIYFKENEGLPSSTSFVEKTKTFVYKPLKYLGLTFDGVNIRIKSAGISKKLSRLKHYKKRIIEKYFKSKKNIPIAKINKKLLNNGFVKYVKRANAIANKNKIKKQIYNLKAKSIL